MGRNRSETQRPQPFRDATLFFIACAGDETEQLYFEELKNYIHSSRIQIIPIPPDEHKSDPANVVELAKQHIDSPNDEYWAVFDIDHNLQGPHIRNLTSALTTCNQCTPIINVAISNPCFEVWLMMHVENHQLTSGVSHTQYENLARALFGTYNKNNISSVPVSEYKRAMEEARQNRRGAHPWPDDFGTDIFKLLDKMLSLL